MYNSVQDKEQLQNLQETERYLRRPRIAAGVALIVVAVLSIIFLALSWNNSGTATDDDSDVLLNAIWLILIFCMIFAIFMLYICRSSVPEEQRVVCVQLVEEP